MTVSKVNWFFFYIIAFIAFGYLFDYAFDVVYHRSSPFGSNLYHGLFSGFLIAYLNLMLFAEKISYIDSLVARRKKYAILIFAIALSLLASFLFNVDVI